MGNISEELNFYAANRQRFKGDLIQFYSGRGFTHALSLSWNIHPDRRAKVGLEQARRDVGSLLARVDRALLGTRFNQRRELRTEAVFVFENIQSNLHAHGLVRVRPGRLLDFHRLFRGERGGKWNDIVRSGTYNLAILDDVRTTVAYIVKEQHLSSDDRMTVWADEFYA